MSIYMTKDSRRFARKAGISDAKLLRAAAAVMDGHYDADLGGGVFKQRVARDGGGNVKANVTPRELTALKRLAERLLGFSDDKLLAAEAAAELIEVMKDGDEET
jgi:hypothetical protein